MQTTINELEGGKLAFEGKAGATLSFDTFTLEERPSFLNYLRAGLQISLVAAIDYTAANGDKT